MGWRTQGSGVVEVIRVFFFLLRDLLCSCHTPPDGVASVVCRGGRERGETAVSGGLRRAQPGCLEESALCLPVFRTTIYAMDGSV